jgi:hypothetical protein
MKVRRNCSLHVPNAVLQCGRIWLELSEIGRGVFLTMRLIMNSSPCAFCPCYRGISIFRSPGAFSYRASDLRVRSRNRHPVIRRRANQPAKADVITKLPRMRIPAHLDQTAAERLSCNSAIQQFSNSAIQQFSNSAIQTVSRRYSREFWRLP